MKTLTALLFILLMAGCTININHDDGYVLKHPPLNYWNASQMPAEVKVITAPFKLLASPIRCVVPYGYLKDRDYHCTFEGFSSEALHGNPTYFGTLTPN